MIAAGGQSTTIMRTWILIGLLGVLIVAKGMFAFWVVGDRGQPTWDYRPLKDVPGESAYAVYPVLPHAQHIRGAKGE